MRYALIAGIALTLAASYPASAQEASGNRAFRRGDLKEAAERYRKTLEGDEGNPRVHYNLGSALLRLGENEDALQELQRALDGHDPELRTRTFYNLGNALVGQPEQDRETLEQAVEAYRRALLLEPENVDAKWNLELAMRRLERMQSQSQSMQQPRSQQPPQDGDQGEQDESGQPPPTGSGSTDPEDQRPQPQLPGDIDEPLPQELAEQILKAVEERERELQREKMRRSPAKRGGPDW